MKPRRSVRRTRGCSHLLGALAAVTSASAAAFAGDFAVTTTGSGTISTSAWNANSSAPYGRAMNGNSFETSTITTFNGYQYAPFWRNTGSGNAILSVARRPVGGAWQVLDVPDMVAGTAADNRIANGPNDAHNIISLGIDHTDGTIHLAYDMHGHTLRYRVSAQGVATNPGSFSWSTGTATTIFSTAEVHSLTGPTINGVTYPMFINTPSNDLQLAFRIGSSGQGSWWIYDYSGASHAWTAARQIDNGLVDTYNGTTSVNSANRNNYPNGFSYDANGRLHSTFTWRESATGAANHDLMYVYSDDGGNSWFNNSGQEVSNASFGAKFHLNSPGLVVRPLAESQSMMNQDGQNVDHANHIHAAVWHRDSAKEPSLDNVWEPQESSYFQYWRDDLGNWHQNKLNGNVGSRPKIFFDADDNAYMIYSVLSGGGALGGGSGSNLYFTNGDLVISAATKASNWTDWRIIKTETGPFVSEAQADLELFKSTGVLSVVMQNSPTLTGNQGTALRTFDYTFNLTAPTTRTLQSSGNWATAGNWSGSAVPGANTVAVINSGRSVTVDSVVPTMDNILIVGSAGSDGSLTVAAGGSLNLLSSGSFGTVYGGSIIVGRDSAAVGTYNQTGGTVNAWRFAVGDYLNETSGGGASSATVSGGSLTVYELDVAFAANGSSSGSSFNVAGGTVTVNGDVVIGEFGNIGTVTLSSGRLTVGGDLREGFNQVNTSSFRIDGGVLDMTGNTIAVDQFIYNGGSLAGVSTTTSQSLAGLNVDSLLAGRDQRVFMVVPAGVRLNTATRVEVFQASTMSLGTGAAVSIGGTPAFTIGQVNISAGGTLAGDGSVQANVNNSGGTVSPGHSAGRLTVDGNYVQGAAGSLKIELAGTTAATQHDQLVVTGTANLAGSLHVSAINGFTPLPGQIFDVMLFGSRSGDVTVFNDTGFAGLALSKSYSASSLSIVADALYEGDANLDGVVDITDLAAMASHWQTVGNWLDGDFNGDSWVDITDLAALATNWQAGIGAASNASAFENALAQVGLGAVSVPEPAAMAAALAVTVAWRRRWNRANS